MVASRKWAGEKTTYQTLPVIGLTLILIANVSDIIVENKLEHVLPKVSNLRFALLSICRVLLQNQLIVMVWLASHYIRLEILIAAPKLLKQSKYVGLNYNEKISVIKAKERIWVGFAFTVCLIYYFFRVLFVALIGK